MSFFRRCRHRGRHRAVPVPPPCDPWAGAPLFDPAVERQAFLARFVVGRAAVAW